MARKLFGVVLLVCGVSIFPPKLFAQSLPAGSSPSLVVQTQFTLDNGQIESATDYYGGSGQGTLIFPQVPLFRFPFNHTPFQDISANPVIYTSDLAAGGSTGANAASGVTTLELSLVGPSGNLPRSPQSIPNLTSIGEPSITVTPTLPASIVNVMVVVINAVIPGTPPQPVHQTAIVSWNFDGSVVVDPGSREPGRVKHFIVTNGLSNESQTLMRFLDPLVGTWSFDHFLNGGLLRADTVTVQRLEIDSLQVTPQPWNPKSGPLSIKGQVAYAVPQMVSPNTSGTEYLTNPTTHQALLALAWNGSRLATTSSGEVTGVSPPADPNLQAFLPEAAANAASATVAFGPPALACAAASTAAPLSATPRSTSALLCPGTYNLVLFAIDPDALAAAFKIAPVIVGEEKIQVQLSPSTVSPSGLIGPDCSPGRRDREGRCINDGPIPHADTTAVTIKVTGASGKTSETVELTAIADLTSGGHENGHCASYPCTATATTNTQRPHGTFLDAQFHLLSPDNLEWNASPKILLTIPIGSDGTGQQTVLYRPSELGGKEDLCAALSSTKIDPRQVCGIVASNLIESKTPLTVSVPGLQDMTGVAAPAGYAFEFAQSTDTYGPNHETGDQLHTGQYHMLSTAARALNEALSNFRDYLGTSAPATMTISFNDMSLSTGGKLDFDPLWCYPCNTIAYPQDVTSGLDQAHRYHRTGRSADINNSPFSSSIIFSGFPSLNLRLRQALATHGWYQVREGGSAHIDYSGVPGTIGVLQAEFPAVSFEPIITSSTPVSSFLVLLPEFPPVAFEPRKWRKIR